MLDRHKCEFDLRVVAALCAILHQKVGEIMHKIVLNLKTKMQIMLGHYFIGLKSTEERDASENICSRPSRCHTL